ncbi:mycofactocin precursor MftA [Streptomyces coeruleorubidus]
MNEPYFGRTEDSHADDTTSPEALIEADALIEEVSIDGMCGVY